MTNDEIEKIATAAAEKALRNMLLVMGLNVEDKNELLAVQKDFSHLRKWRVGVDAMTVKGLMVVTATIVTGIMGAVYAALKH